MATGLRFPARTVGLIVLALLATACGADPATEPTVDEARHPDVIEVRAEADATGAWTFHVTLSSPYDSPERYADAWRIVGPDGTVYGTRELLHDHAGEQPFTRSLSGVTIPLEVEVVTVQGRDQANGWGGATIEHRLDR